MLHQPLRPPAFPLSPSTNAFRKDSADYLYPHDPSSFVSSKKRFPKDPFPRSAFAGFHSPQISVLPRFSSPILATNFTPSSNHRSASSLTKQTQSPSPPLSSSPPPLSSPSSTCSSLTSSTLHDVFIPGDFVGEGCLLQGEPIRLVSLGVSPPTAEQQPSAEFQVKRTLGHGSYAVVYLVQEVLSHPPCEDNYMSTIGEMDFDPSSKIQYGREYAIKCLSKANLDEDELAAQMSEVTIHQSLRSHPNIVTLHRTLETSSYLLLLLEYVPGEDLFYFLEQARDHYDDDFHHSSDSSISRTPPTPSLLSNLHPSQLLSRNRLRLISSMFSQMCDAVAACHSQQVFHRDIKPENFIVTDGWATLPEGRQERKVLVKLSDFGLSTTDISSADMDCGSAPYMSYECRNNIAPTYRPRAADVWSLGIVLINMLYHFNPWTDTAQGVCSSFDLFRKDPVQFFMYRFVGMTRPVAEYLSSKIFCILDNPEDDSPRATAQEFGAWARNLPTFLASHAMHRTFSNSSQGHPIATSTPLSHRPSSRQASTGTAVRTPVIPSRSLSRAPSLVPAYEGPEPTELSIILDREFRAREEEQKQTFPKLSATQDGLEARSASVDKRQKRDAQKGKKNVSTESRDETLVTLSNASQSLTREISRISKTSSTASNGSRLPLSIASLVSADPATKKHSKWRLSFGKNSVPATTAAGRISPVEEASPPSSFYEGSPPINTTKNLFKGSNRDPPTTSNSGTLSLGSYSRNRKYAAPSNDSSRSLDLGSSRSPERGTDRWLSSGRPLSPNNIRNGSLVASSASSTVSSNWRNSSSPSGAVTSTSAFTRYSNSSVRSLASVSSTSWRTNTKSLPSYSSHATAPKNIKMMHGVPWELNQLPRGQHPKPVGDTFGSPPIRKQRTRMLNDGKLDTINERPSGYGVKYQDSQASTSTTDVTGSGNEGDGVKKVQKGQINALAKMLSALKR